MKLKSTFTILFSLLMYSLSFSQQKFDTIYMDSTWKKSSKENAMYYRIINQLENKSYEVKDHWITGELQMTGTLSELYPETNEGLFVYYHKNGKLRQKINYKNNDITGAIEIYDEFGRFDFEYVWDHDSLDNAKDLEKAKHDFYLFTSKKLRYPKYAIEHNIQGQVLVSFYIDQSGSPIKITIENSLSEDLDEETKRVVSIYKWPKLKFHGEKTMVKMKLPVNFILD